MPTSPVEIEIALAGYTWDDWPVFNVTGPVTDFQIQQKVASTSVDVLTLSGDIPAGDTWGFDFRPGYKTISDFYNSYANKMSYVDVATLGAFSTIRLLSDKMAKSISASAASNKFIFTGSGLTAATLVKMYYYKRYLSL